MFKSHALSTVAGFAFVALAIVFAVWGFSRPVLASHQMQILRAAIAVASALAAASFAGTMQLKGWPVAGVAASSGFAVWILTFYFFSIPEGKKPVTFFFSFDGRPVDKRLTFAIRYADTKHTLIADVGKCTDSFPADLTHFDQITVNDDEYVEYASGPLMIASSRTVDVVLVEAEPPPIAQELHPDPRNDIKRLKDAGTKLAEPPPHAIAPASAVLKYRNATSKSLYLLMLKYSSYADGSYGWTDLPVKPSSGIQVYERFGDGSGWLLFYIFDRQNAHTTFIGARNVFEAPETNIVIIEGTNGYALK